MKTRVAINGFGRVGRGSFRIAFDRNDIEVVAINDLADSKTLAHLLKHDTIYGAYGREVSSDESNIIIDGQAIKLLKQPDPALLPWADLGVDVVIEATGRFTDPIKARIHVDQAGAKRVIVSAPMIGEGVTTIVIGVNEDALSSAGSIISGGSCTTNCVTPIVDVLMQNFGVEKAMMTTVHSYTNSQKLLDLPAKDLREARAAGQNIVPTLTGASIAVEQALPDIKGAFGGISVRVPTPIVSLVDLVAVVKRQTSVQEINDVFKKAAGEPYYQGILTYTEEELVSSDFVGNSHSAIIDFKLTNVVGGNLVKIVVWYDNEWGYCNRLVELVADAGKLINKNITRTNENDLEETHLSQE